MDKLSEHAIRMLEIADKPYWNEYNMVNKDLKDTHDIAQAIYELILQVQMLKQMLKMADRKTEPQKCYLRDSCDHYGDKQVCGRCREYNLYSHTKTEPQIIACPIQEEDAEYARWLCEPRTDYERGRQDAWDIAQKVFDSTVTLYEAEDVAKQIEKDEPQTDCAWGKGGNNEQYEL